MNFMGYTIRLKAGTESEQFQKLINIQKQLL